VARVGTRIPVQLRSSTDDREWDELVARHPNATAFHLSRFLRTAGPSLGLRTWLAVAEVDGETVGVVPMLVRPVGPFVLVNHGLPFPNLGPLLSPEVPLDTVLAALRRRVRPRSVLHAGFESIAPFPVPETPGWLCHSSRRRAVVTLADEDEEGVLRRLAPQQRSRARRAVKQGLVSGPATRAEIADHMVGWANQTLARQGLRPLWPGDALVRIFDALAPAGVAEATAVRRDGEVLAASISLFSARRLIAWEIGVGEEGRTTNATLVLYAAMLCRARELGAVEVDLLGAPTEGIARFKQSLGADLLPRGAAQWQPPWLPAGRWRDRAGALLSAVRG
jgi:CelD/BcsL family acetyltransferase involved in cellulose biosynthesis